jgi:hypothetical protein
VPETTDVVVAEEAAVGECEAEAGVGFVGDAVEEEGAGEARGDDEGV